jgi:2-polyprenyl-6-methoxyphenol hydroxylase-like FAD-dependent oxidoreductase
MMRDVFGQHDLFSNFHPIRKRVVAWGPGTEPVSLDHSAVVVSERQLLESVSSVPSSQIDADWTVITSRPLPEGTIERHFGSRIAAAVPVALTGSPDTCWIESLEHGWIFLIPNSEKAGWLLAVGADPDALLAESRVVAPQISGSIGESSRFPAYPRIMQPLCGATWLACGSAAMAFDPLCGDGTANAVREAILAAAVIRTGPDALSHYEARLTAGFQRHLSLCVSFYQSANTGPWWQMELDLLHEGLAWCKSRSFGAYQYQLNGFDLVPVLP